jgi:hypothetical protein
MPTHSRIPETPSLPFFSLSLLPLRGKYEARYAGAGGCVWAQRDDPGGDHVVSGGCAAA